MSSSIYAGYTPMPGRWHSGVRLGGVNAPPIELELDPQLPVLGRDMNLPNRDFIVIPRGRIVACKATDLTRLSGKSLLTVATGVDPKDPPSFASGLANIPNGYAPYHIYRSFSGLPADKPLFVRHETIELPYTAINESYNTADNGGLRLKVGEWVMPYFGSATKKTGVAKDRGKLVRWLPKRMFHLNASSASGNLKLTGAPFPFAKPRVLLAFDGTGALIASGASAVVYDEGLAAWRADFSGTSAKTVIYEWGADADMRIGQIVGIEPVGTAGGINATSHEMHGWLKWVTDNFSAWDWPPIMSRRPTSSVTDEVVSIDANNEGQLANFPVVPFLPITVKLTGSVVDEDGSTRSYNGEELEKADDLFFNDQTQGKYYDIDMLTGKIRLSSNVTVTRLTVSYSYEADWKDGLKYDAGQLGLTDGSQSGIAGLPPHLDVAGVVGAMRVMIL